MTLVAVLSIFRTLESPVLQAKLSEPQAWASWSTDASQAEAPESKYPGPLGSSGDISLPATHCGLGSLSAHQVPAARKPDWNLRPDGAAREGGPGMQQ